MEPNCEVIEVYHPCYPFFPDHIPHLFKQEFYDKKPFMSANDYLYQKYGTWIDWVDFGPTSNKNEALKRKEIFTNYFVKKFPPNF